VVQIYPHLYNSSSLQWQLRPFVLHISAFQYSALQTWHFLRIFAKRQVENENIIIHNQVCCSKEGGCGRQPIYACNSIKSPVTTIIKTS